MHIRSTFHRFSAPLFSAVLVACFMILAAPAHAWQNRVYHIPCPPTYSKPTYHHTYQHPTPARSYSSDRVYYRYYGGSGHMVGVRYNPGGGTYNGYTGPGGGVDAPTRQAWLNRLRNQNYCGNGSLDCITTRDDGTYYINRWRTQNLNVPCGAYGRMPTYCRMATRRYDPIIDGN